MDVRDDLVQIEVEVDTIESFTSSEDEEVFI
jgi:hypothetical protein